MIFSKVIAEQGEAVVRDIMGVLVRRIQLELSLAKPMRVELIIAKCWNIIKLMAQI